MLRLRADQLFDQMSDGVLVIDRSWNIAYSNSRALEITGADELAGTGLWDAFPSARGTVIEDVYRRVLATGRSETCEYYSDDLAAWFEIRAVPVDGVLAAFFRDVSDQWFDLERAEARRRALDALFDQVFLGIMQVDAELRPILVNDHLCTLAGRSRHELRELSFDQWIHPDDAKAIATALASPDIVSVPDLVVRMARPDGSSRRCSVKLSPGRTGDIRRHSILVFDDVTDQHEAERKAADTAALLRTIIDSAQDLIFVKDREGRFVLTNRALAESAPPLLGQTVDDHFAPNLATGYAAADAEVLRTGRPSTVEERIPLKDGERTFQTIKVPWRSGDALLGVIGISRDITERLAAEARLRANEERHRLAALATKDAIWDWDLTSGQVTWNPAIAQLCGDRPGPEAGWWKDRIHPEDRAVVLDSIAEFTKSDEERWEQEYRFRRADGSYAHVFDRGFLVRDESGEPARMIGAMVDLSERTEAFQRLADLQTELIHVSRVSAMGTMASALAHELNQPLTGVANYVSGARRLLMEGGAAALDAALPALAEAAEEVIKAGEIIRRLRRMVARGQVEVQQVELDPLVKDALSLAIPNSRLTQVEVETRLAGACVLGDPIQIQQVLVNLIRNATEAIEGQPVRRLTIWAEHHDASCRIHVRDTGTGVPPHIVERLFAPFTTTKADGLGVGLMISRTILEAHRGSIGLLESGSQGTTMFFELPAPTTHGSAIPPSARPSRDAAAP
jgi:two-component system sensor kinase FixL